MPVRRRHRPALPVLLVIALSVAASARDHPRATSTHAALDRFRALVASRPSATAVLHDWCAERRLAPDPRIVAHRVEGAAKRPTPAQRRALGIDAREPVRHRRVQLLCGSRILSEADNWYVPSRLTPAMNAALDATDTPFGMVIAPLRPYRQTLASRILGNAASRGKLPPPYLVLEVRALVRDRQRRPLALVTESYTRNILAGDAPT